jgi:hypothetical protein
VANKNITAGKSNQVICSKAVNSRKGFLNIFQRNLSKCHKGINKFQNKGNSLDIAEQFRKLR